MKFKELKKQVMANVNFESLGAVGVDAFLFDLPEDRKYSIRVEFRFGANADKFLERGEWEVALNSLVDLYFERVRNILSSELLTEFFEDGNKIKSKLKAELLTGEIVCKVEAQGKIFKDPVIVIRNGNLFYPIDFPSTWYSTNPTLARSIDKVGYEIIVKPADKTVKKKLLTVLGKEFR